jgi:hypothetical protein
MHTLLVVLAINLVMFGMAFSIAGFLGMAPPNQAEFQAEREAYEREQPKGFWQREIYGLRVMQRKSARFWSIIAAHWRQRPQYRRLLFLGLSMLAGAFLLGYFLGSFS